MVQNALGAVGTHLNRREFGRTIGGMKVLRRETYLCDAFGLPRCLLSDARSTSPFQTRGARTWCRIADSLGLAAKIMHRLAIASVRTPRGALKRPIGLLLSHHATEIATPMIVTEI